MDQTAALTIEQWQEVLDVLLIPIKWIIPVQKAIVDFFIHSSSAWAAIGKYLFLLFPLLLLLGALWCTQLSLYTVLFRSKRINFITTILLTWWDGVRSVWLYWVGLFRLVVVVLGWIFSVGRLAVKFLVVALKHILLAPFAMTGRMTKSFFRPGVPWIAFLALVFWCILEAVIFSFVLFPTISEVLMDIVGTDEVSGLTSPMLFIFLLSIIQMVVIELIVMGFEVMFLYRELVDAITPWIVQQTGVRVGMFFTLTVSSFGWIAIRGMTWFLFAQYGTPPLLALISRQPVEQAREGEREAAPDIQEISSWWRQPLQEFKNEIDWLHQKFNELLEFLTLPVLQVMAVILNFCTILLTSKPVFNLPFKSLRDVMDTREILVARGLATKTGDET
jgi:hypothetical protein